MEKNIAQTYIDMAWKRLPLEVQRLVFEFDNTYITHYQHCINELHFLQTTYPVSVETIRDDVPHYRRFTPVSEIVDLNRFILSYCLRKKSLRNYRCLKTRENYILSLQEGCV